MNSHHTVTILIIEDDESVRRTLADILELNGYTTLSAADGTEGLAVAKRDLPSVIITDLNMPGMTGFELLEAFRSDEMLRTIPVIVISAKVDRAATRHGMELGAADFITKPFSEDEVLHSITARLEKKELLDELDAFSHTVAHDLKNPLATLSGRLEILSMMLGKSDEALLRHQLSEARNSAVWLRGIIDELLLLAGVRRQTVTPVPLDMTAIVAEATAHLGNFLAQHSATLELPAAWPAAAGHAPWVVQVWVNYLSNAAKYGGPNARILLGGESVANGRSARFWVQDHGPGLTAEEQAKMFVPFSRISTAKASGHGLGLSIVRRIIEKLGGKVGVTSEPGAGTRFWFELPATARRKTKPPFSAP